LVGVVSDGAGGFPCFTETQHGAGATVAGIGGDIDVRRLVFVINYGETVGAEDQAFDVVKRGLVFGGPRGTPCRTPSSWLGG
jgi:hypothetical protein